MPNDNASEYGGSRRRRRYSAIEFTGANEHSRPSGVGDHMRVMFDRGGYLPRLMILQRALQPTDGLGRRNVVEGLRCAQKQHQQFEEEAVWYGGGVDPLLALQSLVEGHDH
jgi:hypothetical protein